MENQQKYLVAIRCITYNHEKYLADALEGFVMQKTNFPFVAIVHDDASTDGTAAILRKYAEKYPDIIHPIYETENQYSKHDGSLGRIMNEAIAATGAKYIAMCEGDDYWTDPYKLQKQVDFMEAHSDCVMCCQNAYQDFNGCRRLFVNANMQSGYLTLQEMLEKWQVTSASILYRKETLANIDCSKSYPNGDYSLELRLMSQGKIYYDSLVTSVYRMHGDSMSAHMNRHKVKSLQDLIKLLQDMKELYPVEQHYLFDEAIARYKAMIEDHVRSTHPVKKWFYRKTYSRAIKRLLRRIAR